MYKMICITLVTACEYNKAPVLWIQIKAFVISRQTLVRSLHRAVIKIFLYALESRSVSGEQKNGVSNLYSYQVVSKNVETSLEQTKR